MIQRLSKHSLTQLCCLLLLMGGAQQAQAQSFDIHTPDSKRGAADVEILNGANLGSPHGRQNDLRNAHEFKYVYGISDRWTFEVGALVEKADASETRLGRISLENIFVVRPPVSHGFGFGWYAATEIATSDATHNTLLFGPLIQFNAGKGEFLFNPIIQKTFGQNATSGIDFNYLWRAKYELRHGLGIGAMGYGNIEDVGSGPSFNQQDHRIGPAIFLDFEIERGRELGVSIGTYFGITRASPDASLMVNLGIPLNRR